MALGHELRHVLEVAAEPGITGTEAFAAFYRSTGHEWKPAHVDTADARDAGLRVAAELGTSPE